MEPSSSPNPEQPPLGEPPQSLSGPNPLFVLIRDAAHRLESIGAGNPRLEAEYLMAAAMAIPRMRLWLTDAVPDDAMVARFDALLARRLAREPLQYVLGTAEFAGLTLEVGPGVFIPRSETEVLVERVAERLPRGPARIIDVGVGSGAILLALLARLAEARGVGVDRSAEAIAYARRNAERAGVAARAAFVRGDLLEAVRPGRDLAPDAGATARAGPSWDAIVSNPPYVMTSERVDLAPEIRDHEPPQALFAGDDGLDVIRRLIPAAAERLRGGGLLAIEIGITQGEAVLALLGAGPWKDARVEPDLAGRPRIALARRR